MNKDKKVTKEFVEKVENGFQSRIFTQTELTEMKERVKNMKPDSHGLISNRIKPKIAEIRFWNEYDELLRKVENKLKNRKI